MAVSIPCPGCGQRLPIPGGYKRREIQCPECGVICAVPAPAPQAISPPAVPARPKAPAHPALEGQAPLGEPDLVKSDADDGRPYQLVSGDEHKCPDCGRLLAKDATLCPHCGLNWETGKKAIRVYEPLALHWDAGLPFQGRLGFFVIAECAALLLALVGAFLAGHPGESVTSWLLFTLLLAFLLGTFDRLDLTRSKRGRVVLAQTWRVLFIARPTTTIPLREYEGVMTNISHDTGPLDWVILGVALLSGIIPGLIWWFWAMQQDTYQVALTKDHGYPERILYRGWSQSRAKEIARTLHDVCGLPLEGNELT